MKSFFTKLAFLLTFTAPAFAFAASPFLKPVKDLLGDLEIFIRFLNYALPALAVILFFLLIVVYIAGRFGLSIGGLKAEDMKGSILPALVGLAILFTVYGLIQLLGALIGVDTNRSKTITAPSLPEVGGIRGGGYYNGGN